MEAMVSATPTTAFQFNFKLGNDLHNIYAENGQEAIDLLSFFETDVLPALVSVTEKVNAATAVATPTQYAAAPAQYTAPAVPAQAAPAGDGGHVCDHGQPMKLIPAGISRATNKPYKAFYVCGQPRGMQCDKKVTT